MRPTQRPNRNSCLDVSLELAGKAWKIALTDGCRPNPALSKVDVEHLGARLEALVDSLQEFKSRWGLAPDCPVALIYEAGQDGFWIARALTRRVDQAVTSLRDGASQVLEYLAGLRFTVADLDWMAGSGRFSAEFLRSLSISSEASGEADSAIAGASGARSFGRIFANAPSFPASDFCLLAETSAPAKFFEKRIGTSERDSAPPATTVSA